jgi:hypothetical protein
MLLYARSLKRWTVGKTAFKLHLLWIFSVGVGLLLSMVLNGLLIPLHIMVLLRLQSLSEGAYWFTVDCVCSGQ